MAVIWVVDQEMPKLINESFHLIVSCLKRLGTGCCLESAEARVPPPLSHRLHERSLYLSRLNPGFDVGDAARKANVKHFALVAFGWALLPCLSGTPLQQQLVRTH